MKEFLFIVYLFFSLLTGSSICIKAQSNCYTQLYDGSGYPVERHHGQLNAAACALIAAFPREYQDSFQVYDFGFYLHNEVMAEGLGGIFQKALSSIPNKSKYHLIFGKQSDRSGIYTKLWVQLNLPRSGEFSCFSDQQYDDIVHNLEATSNLDLQLGGISSYVGTEISTMQLLQGVIEELVDCCDPASALRSSECLLSYGSEAYIELDGVKYANGSTMYLFWDSDDKDKDPKLDGYQVQLEPYYDRKPFTKTRWNNTDVNRENGGWYYRVRGASSSISGLRLEATGTVTIGSEEVAQKVFITIVIVSIEYSNTDGSKFEFDENNKNTENDYPSFQFTRPEGLPWKALGANQMPEMVKATILPVGLDKLITYQLSNTSRFDFQTTQDGSDILIKITSKTTTPTDADLIPSIKGVQFDRGILKLVSLKISLAVKIPVIRVKQAGSITSYLDFSPAALDEKFKEVFHSVGYFAEAGVVEDAEINFDDNNDGYFDPTNEREYDLLLQGIEDLGTVGNQGSGIGLVLIAGLSPTVLKGRNGEAVIEKKLALVYQADSYTTCAHEIGHVLGLQHPWEEFTTYPNRALKVENWTPKDTRNLMEWGVPGWPRDKTRKYQWSYIRE